MIRRACWSQCEIRVRGWIRRVSIIFSRLSLRPNLKAWAWGWRSVARLSRPTAGGYGPYRTTVPAQRFNSRCTLVLKKKALESINFALRSAGHHLPDIQSDQFAESVVEGQSSCQARDLEEMFRCQCLDEIIKSINAGNS